LSSKQNYKNIATYKEHSAQKTYHPKFELKGKLFDEETVLSLYPKLAEKFMRDN